MLYFMNKDMIDKMHNASCYRAYIKQKRDAGGYFYALHVSFKKQHELYYFPHLVLNADTLDELKIWCDMNNITIDSIDNNIDYIFDK